MELRPAAVAVLGVILTVIVGAAARGGSAMSLTLTSSAFSHEGEIPGRYTCQG